MVLIASWVACGNWSIQRKYLCRQCDTPGRFDNYHYMKYTEQLLHIEIENTIALDCIMCKQVIQTKQGV